MTDLPPLERCPACSTWTHKCSEGKPDDKNLKQCVTVQSVKERIKWLKDQIKACPKPYIPEAIDYAIIMAFEGLDEDEKP